MKVKVKNLKRNRKYKLPWPFKRPLGGGKTEVFDFEDAGHHVMAVLSFALNANRGNDISVEIERDGQKMKVVSRTGLPELMPEG
jgi:hypothetical protein